MAAQQAPPRTFDPTSKAIHWLTFFLIFFMLLLGWFMGDLPKDSVSRIAAYITHKSTGLFILLLTLFRIAWIVRKGKPPLAHQPAWWEIAAEKTVQGGLYLCLLGLPISGWVMSTAAGKAPTLGFMKVPLPFVPLDKSLAKLANGAHHWLIWGLLIFLTLHILAALKHHFVNKDEVLQRMMPENRHA